MPKLRFLLELLKYRLDIFGKQVILLDTPEHDNLGDQAIAEAEIRFLQENRIRYAEVSAAKLERREKWFARFTPTDKTILIQGGGFLGSLWPNEEYRVQRILRCFSKNKILVFPQTVYYGAQDALFRDAEKIYNAHPNLTILARDADSFEFLKEHFPNVRAEFVPDMVLYLQPDLARQQRKGALLCLRDDPERALSDETAEMLKALLHSRFGDNVRRTDTLCGYAVDCFSRREAVRRKLEEFAGAQLVVTDRLHGMLFSAVTGTPCIAFNNCNGKVGGVYHWLKNLDYIFLAENAESFRTALELVNPDEMYTYNRKQFRSYFDRIKEMICRK